MVEYYYRAIIEILSQHGFEKVAGGKGSHEKWRNSIIGRTVIVPRSRRRHTANAVLKQAGIDHKF
jgi:predicted RNA binding protein YcfA (HicA-like mRNA interferase family)